MSQRKPVTGEADTMKVAIAQDEFQGATLTQRPTDEPSR